MNKKSELPKQSFHPEAYDYSFEGEERDEPLIGIGGKEIVL